MEDIQIRCPLCGKPMLLDAETEIGTCPHCGNEVWQEPDPDAMAESAAVTEEERAAIVAQPQKHLAEALAKKDFPRARIALFDGGAKADDAPSYKGTPVPHVVAAVDWNDLDVLEFLLENGADPYEVHKVGSYEGEGTRLPGEQKTVFDQKFRHSDPQYGTAWVECSAADLAALHRDGRAAKLIADKSQKPEPGSGCYIATAVYGSYAAPEVRALRRWRDECLLQSAPGRAFVRAYYRVSPPLAKRLARAARLNRLVKRALDRFVWRLGL